MKVKIKDEERVELGKNKSGFKLGSVYSKLWFWPVSGFARLTHRPFGPHLKWGCPVAGFGDKGAGKKKKCPLEVGPVFVSVFLRCFWCV